MQTHLIKYQSCQKILNSTLQQHQFISCFCFGTNNTQCHFVIYLLTRQQQLKYINAHIFFFIPGLCSSSKVVSLQLKILLWLLMGDSCATSECIGVIADSVNSAVESTVLGSTITIPSADANIEG